MKQERVIAILDFYRDIDKTVTMNERVIRNLEDQYYSTLGAVNSDGMPHGKGGVSNPVERVVLNIPQSVSDTIANMRRENEKLTAIKGEILSELNALNYREKAVIYGFYIDGLQWERLSQRVNYSPRQCRNIRNIALERLAKRFEQKNTSMICIVLRGTDGKTDRLRSCRGCVMDCAQIVEEVLFPGEFEPYDGPSEL